MAATAHPLGAGRLRQQPDLQHRRPVDRRRSTDPTELLRVLQPRRRRTASSTRSSSTGSRRAIAGRTPTATAPAPCRLGPRPDHRAHPEPLDRGAPGQPRRPRCRTARAARRRTRTASLHTIDPGVDVLRVDKLRRRRAPRADRRVVELRQPRDRRARRVRGLLGRPPRRPPGGASPRGCGGPARCRAARPSSTSIRTPTRATRPAGIVNVGPAARRSRRHRRGRARCSAPGARRASG